MLLGSTPGAGARERLTAVVGQVNSTPEAVLGDDRRRHFAYELELVNRAPTKVTVKRIEVLAGGRVVDTMSAKQISVLMSPYAGRGLGNELKGGQGGYVLMDVSFPAKGRLPRRLVQRITIAERHPSPANAKTYLIAPTPVVGRPAVVVAPPLRGPGWVVANGCCASFTAHRGTVLPVNGANHVAERFAIDFVQVDPMGRLFEGPLSQISLSSYPYFGDPVHSATGGRVVRILDGVPETPAGGFPPHPTAESAGGNHVVVDMGRGRFAFYAHLQPGSIRVRVGQPVRVGEVIGLLGNSGNSDGPHLHFHVMDGPAPLASDGLPYRFSRFRVEGTLVNLPDFEKGAVARVERRPRGLRAKMLPLDNQVIDFGP
jgi:hypothetical protein